MRRTQLYIDDVLLRLLRTISLSRKTTISELVRDALKKVYGKDHGLLNPQEALDASFGIWSKRKDLIDTQKYVRTLRKGKRAKDLGLL